MNRKIKGIKILCADMSGSMHLPVGLGKSGFLFDWAKRMGIELVTPQDFFDNKPCPLDALRLETHKAEAREEFEKLKVKNPIREYLDREAIRNHPYYEALEVWFEENIKNDRGCF